MKVVDEASELIKNIEEVLSDPFEKETPELEAKDYVWEG